MANPQAKLIGQGILAGKERKHTVEIDLTEFDQSYKGTFTFHHPTLVDRMNIGLMKAKMLEGLEGKVDVITDNIAHMTATLTYVIDDAPAWFKVNEIYDYQVLDTVFEVYNEWVGTFRK